jgi:hypothetical protein
MIPNEGNGLLVDWDLSKNSENVNIEGPPWKTGEKEFLPGQPVISTSLGFHSGGSTFWSDGLE